MAFSSLVDDARRMNAKMISMGQSVDIQKMPRPKAGSASAQKQAMYTPSGSDLEKLLYPKNFAPRSYTEEKTENHTEVLNNSTKEMLEEIEEVAEQKAEEKAKPKMIGDDAVIMPRSKQRTDDRHCNIIKNVVIESQNGVYSQATWKTCRYMKEEGGRVFCKEYLSLCGKEKCNRARR